MIYGYLTHEEARAVVESHQVEGVVMDDDGYVEIQFSGGVTLELFGELGYGIEYRIKATT